MTTLAKGNLLARDAVGKLEHRFGRRKLYWGGGFILLVALLLTVRTVANRPKQKQPPGPRVVTTAKVITQDVPLYLDEIGSTAAYETVQIQAQVSGQIVSREFKDGADVKKGDLLFLIDPKPYEAALASAQADLALSQATFKRQEELKAKNVTASQEWDTAQANARRSEAAVAAAQVNLDRCYIKSPIDGRAGLRNVDIGNVVGPGGTTPLLTIMGMDPIYTDFTVAEPDLPLVRRYLNNPNLKVVTDAEEDNIEPRAGTLYFIDNAVQAGAGTVKLRGVTPNPDRALWPSQFVKVRLILDVLKDAKLIPSTAVQIGQNGPYVFVVKPDSTLELRQVKPGQRQSDLTVITDGVQMGEMVVTSGQLQLSPGMKVNPRPDESNSGEKPAGSSAGSAGH
ncbi:MAG TPA: efflux RND transporter periplasmic adaptor subunit [Chthoniobacterales bacterium]|nr:efflux RND transporter periplasmic adaptor subunit [Chthoniobacterales bacterium]